MRISSKIFLAAAVTVLGFSGCYTQLMTPQEFVETQRDDIARADASSSLNYNQNCYSCHSKAELDDRYIDWKYYGVTTAHGGITVEPIAWNNPYTAPVYEPDPYGWYNPAPSQPWWLPPAVVGSVSSSTAPSVSTKPVERTRTDGSTRRDNGGERSRTEPIPAQSQSQSQTPTGDNTSTSTSSSSSTPPPAVSTTPPTRTQTSSTPANSERSKSDSNTSNTDGKTRDNGSTRRSDRSR